ncbi:hypothetical protein BDN72DRAFT_216011 [Pluteus cervinus]|uniref:Uncharacterized protein n=1 Tax=Pluteus cervinus TaxID=181527 RepID=A0ACD3B8H5_9AGAR|nr:hypothetical protein BDN72DRAFT_216011 [Pluteus cervinus]
MSSSFLKKMLEFVAEHFGHDEASLTAFSLVSRNFLSACRVRLFRPSPSCIRTMSRTPQTDGGDPDLTRHVRCLTLVLERSLGNDPNLPWIIQRLDNLQSIRLLSRCVVAWDSISPELQDALHAVFPRSTTLNNLVIELYESIPVEIIRGVRPYSSVSRSMIVVGPPTHPYLLISR